MRDRTHYEIQDVIYEEVSVREEKMNPNLFDPYLVITGYVRRFSEYEPNVYLELDEEVEKSYAII